MTSQNSNDPNNEIDLSRIATKARKYVSGVNDSFFDGILFLKRNVIIILAILLVGGVLGYLMDDGPKAYTHKIIVSPNFESVDYLYQAVDQIGKKIKEKDSVFLKNIGIKEPARFRKIRIDPVVDIYNFIDESEDEQIDDRKFAVLKLMAEDGAMQEILEDNVTSRNYKNHLITIITREKVNKEDLVLPLIAHFNSNPYFKQMQEVELNNVNLKLAANDSIIKQLDKMFSYFIDPSRKTGSNTVYYNDNAQLAEAMKLKDQLLKEQAKLRVNRANFTEIIKESGMLLNEKNTGGLTGKMKFVVPVFFFMLFVLVVWFRAYYRSQLNKRKIIITND